MRWRSWWCAGVLSLAACARAPELQFVDSAQVRELKPEYQEQIRKVLAEHCGLPDQPKLLGAPPASPRDALKLQLGFQVYQKRCVQCHGVSGDGNGPSASAMYPRPRDYRKGVFKFTSTPYGSKPVRDDLVSTVRRGVAGTSMPSFHLLPDKELQAVVDYVLVLTHRGELEGQLAGEVSAADEFDPEIVPESIELIQSRWREAAANVYQPLSTMPVFTAEHIAAGKKAFLSRGCSKCHGEDGRGQTAENLRGDLKDTWGHATRAADLTSGMLHGGPRPLDVYRRIYGGINGTPMPAFSQALQSEPETVWQLVAYVLYVSERRRAGETPPAGNLAPYLGAPAASPAVTQR